SVRAVLAGGTVGVSRPSDVAVDLPADVARGEGLRSRIHLAPGNGLAGPGSGAAVDHERLYARTLHVRIALDDEAAALHARVRMLLVDRRRRGASQRDLLVVHPPDFLELRLQAVVQHLALLGAKVRARGRVEELENGERSEHQQKRGHHAFDDGDTVLRSRAVEEALPGGAMTHFSHAG